MAASPVTEWYKGKTIFLTGGSGFMGKVLLEKLLYSCDGVKNIYILLRSKKGKSPVQRIEDMWKLPLFNRLREKDPNALKKIVPLTGDLNTDGLGLNSNDLNLLISNTNIVFHLGATLKLEANLKDAVEQNTAGTARVVEIAKKIKNLMVFAHFSTAFCSADIDTFEEKVYDCSNKPLDVIEVAKWMNLEALDKATKALIAPHPNTYTYTKRLAEKLVADESKTLPVCIIRPSIVTPAAVEPLPGWVDSLNGPMGLLVGGGKGVIRSMHAKPENGAQVVPVDIAINASIVIAYKLGSSKVKPKEVPVYNLTQHEVLPISMGEVLEIGRKVVHEYPFEGQIWYPDGDLRSSLWVHYLFCIVWHWMPAYLIDFLMLIFRQKQFMVYIQTRIHNGLELLQFFTVRQWDFKSSNFLNLSKELTELDNKTFPMDFTILSIPEYLKICVLGARQYLMKEPLSSLPRCRAQQKVLFVIHKFVIYSFYLSVIWMIASHSEIAKNLLDSVGAYMQRLPMLNGISHSS